MKMIRDVTGRFPERPHYSKEELDGDCEHIVSAFLTERHGSVKLPITTDELTILIEQNEATIDSYADLSRFGDDVEGMTAFYPDRGPEVSISENIAREPHRENRLRTTLAHEFGHVYYHRALWAAALEPSGLFSQAGGENKAICRRDTILNANERDWMEWQASYVSGAILMPVSRIKKLVGDFAEHRGLHAQIFLSSEAGFQIVGAVTEAFRVSADAARIRLLKLSLLASSDNQPSLFG
jgi:Zn-dependent peptidase ImmA (M78 family)